MFEGIPIVDLTERGVLLIVVLMFLWGKIVPRKSLTDEREDTAHWRAAHAELSKQLTELLEHARTTNTMLRSIQERAEKRREDP